MHRHIFVVRHGATEWSDAGRHTSTTDVDLTDTGRRQAAALCRELDRRRYGLVLTSPLVRARETARIAGFAGAVVDDDLMEWDYGEYEGLTTAEISERDPGWSVFTHECPGGETADEVARRARRVLERCDAAPGNALIFAHSHVIRVFTAVAIELDPHDGAHFVIAPAATGVIGHERGTRAVQCWNRQPVPL